MVNWPIPCTFESCFKMKGKKGDSPFSNKADKYKVSVLKYKK